MNIKQCTIVAIHHEDPDVPTSGTVWMFAGDGRENRVERNLPGWFKIIGPIKWSLVLETQVALQKFFERNGIQVFCETFAD